MMLLLLISDTSNQLNSLYTAQDDTPPNPLYTAQPNPILQGRYTT
jgi:hypothetical protein